MFDWNWIGFDRVGFVVVGQRPPESHPPEPTEPAQGVADVDQQEDVVANDAQAGRAGQGDWTAGQDQDQVVDQKQDQVQDEESVGSPPSVGRHGSRKRNWKQSGVGGFR